MKKIYLLFALVIFMSSCQKDEVSLDSEETIFSDAPIMQIPFYDLPSHIAKSLDAQGLISNKGHKKTSPFGAVKSDFPAFKNINKKGQISWTLRLSNQNISDEIKSTSNLYFDNLVIKELEDKRLAKYIFRYFPQEEWYYSSGRTLANYTGKISVFNIDGENIGNTRVENGKGINKQSAGEGKMTTCTLALNDVVCFGGEGSMLDQPFTCTFIYNIGSCTEDTSGGGDTPTYNPDPNTGISESDDTSTADPGGGTNDGSEEVETLPLLDHCLITNTCEVEIRVINNLEGKAECIYNVLGGTAVGNLNIIHNVFLTFSDMQYNPADIIYQQEAGLVNDDGLSLNGRTSKDGEDYVVTLNSDRINNRSSIEIAKTILHESVHAILKRRYNVYPNGFMDSFKKYVESETGSNNVTHAIMRDYYIEPMINNLRQFDNSRENDTFYRNLAWEGLHQFLTESEKDEIRSTLDEARARDGAMNCGEY